MKRKNATYPAVLKDWFSGKLTVRERQCLKLGVYIVSFFYVIPLVAISFIMLIFLLLINKAFWFS